MTVHFLSLCFVSNDCFESMLLSHILSRIGFKELVDGRSTERPRQRQRENESERTIREILSDAAKLTSCSVLRIFRFLCTCKDSLSTLSFL